MSEHELDAQATGVAHEQAAPVHAAGVTPAIECRDYCFGYAGTDVDVLHGVSFSLEPGAFSVLCGLTGSGKSTLLRAMKPEIAVEGRSSGQILIMGDDPADLAPSESAARTGFVMQDPENQLVTDTVWHELAFGLENLGVPREEMRRRVAETAHFFGIGAWFDRKVSELSGGQKQLLNLAAVVVMQPQVLLLDEPTSQLDPIAAKSFFDVLGRVNAELGITVVIIEHRLEDVLPMASRVLYLQQGNLVFDGTPDGFIGQLVESGDTFAWALPAATRIAHLTGYRGQNQPVTVRDGRLFLAHLLQATQTPQDGGEQYRGDVDRETSSTPLSAHLSAAEGKQGSAQGTAHVATTANAAPHEPGEVALRAKDLWFRYDKSQPFVLRGVDIEVRRGQVHAIVGGNGSGKSTMLAALAGVRKAERGKVRKTGDVRVALLAQDPKSLFVSDTLWDDLMEWHDYGGYGEQEVRDMVRLLQLEGLEQRHPYDLSGGETQKAAIAKVLLLNPDVLLMDEPVKGIDAVTKRVIAQVVARLAHEGKAVLFTAHDLEFVSQTADICSMMFGYQVTCTQECHGFFTDNLFYSTATSRITRRLFDGCVTTEDVAAGLAARGVKVVGEYE